MTQIITPEFLVGILSLATATALVNLSSEETGDYWEKPQYIIPCHGVTAALLPPDGQGQLHH